MADRRRIVTLDSGRRPIVDIDLETGDAYQAIRDTFAYTPGAQNQVLSREPGRYGGQQTVGEENDNGTVTWQALIRGSTPDLVAANIETVLAQANRDQRGRLLEWRPDGSSYSSYFRIAGPVGWKPTYKWAQWAGAQSMVVDITVPVRPLVIWDQPRILDSFYTDTRADYTFDAASSNDINIVTSSNQVTVTGAAATVERRARHTARGYKFLEAQATIYSKPNGTLTNYKTGVLLRASAANTYVEAYVDDNGTNSRLRIDVIIAGTRTNRASVNLGARINTSGFHIRGRVEGQTVYAEYFVSALFSIIGPMDTPTSSVSYTLTGGEQSSLPAGHTGWSWAPQTGTGTYLMFFRSDPWTYRNKTLPQLLEPLDPIPGTAPALASVDITPSGGSDNPSWAMVAWLGVMVQGAPNGSMPISIGEIETTPVTFTGGLATNATVSARGGTDVRDTASGAETYTFTVGSALAVEPDEFTDARLDVEVWARLVISSGLVDPRATLSCSILGSAIPRLSTRHSIEYGAAGKALTKPTSGTVYRFVRLGTVPYDLTAAQAIDVKLTCATGSTGAFGADYAILVPANRRAVSMTGVPASETVDFVPTTDQWTKRIRHDLSATIADAVLGQGGGSTGLGGSLITPNPGMTSWLIKLSNLVPDDPTADTTSEQLAHQAAVTLDIVPRSYMLRAA